MRVQWIEAAVYAALTRSAPRTHEGDGLQLGAHGAHGTYQPSARTARGRGTGGLRACTAALPACIISCVYAR